MTYTIEITESKDQCTALLRYHDSLNTVQIEDATLDGVLRGIVEELSNR